MIAGVTTTGLVILGVVALGGLLSGALGVFFTTRDLEMPGVTSYARLMLVAAGWSFAYFVLLLAPNRPTAIVLFHVYNAFIMGVLVFWLEFTTRYTGVRQWFSGTPRAATYGFLAGYYLLVVTNPAHGLIYSAPPAITTVEGLTLLTHYRTAFSGVLLVITYLLVAAGFVILVRFFLATRNVYRKQTATILVGGLLVAVSSAVHFAGWLPAQQFDPTPLLFVVNGLFIGVALVRYDFLEVVPLAADMLIEEMDDPVIVVDDGGRVLDVNAAGMELFDDDPVGEPLTAVAPDLDATVADGERLTRWSPYGSTTYDPRTTAITDQHGIERGTLVVLRDVTAQVERQAELERQNERLEEFASVVSHDLRNPLSVAHAYAQTALDEDDVSFVAQTVESLDRMNELIDDLLALAREGQDIDDPAPVGMLVTKSCGADRHHGVLQPVGRIGQIDPAARIPQDGAAGLLEDASHRHVQRLGQSAQFRLKGAPAPADLAD